jgi:hypothetical protein
MSGNEFMGSTITCIIRMITKGGPSVGRRADKFLDFFLNSVILYPIISDYAES